MDILNNFDFSKIVRVDSDIETPIHGHEVSTSRAHCAGIPLNSTILDKLENLSKLNIIVDKTFVCDNNLFTRPIKTIQTLEELLKRLSEVLIRFDANPSDYQKLDYLKLLSLITESLSYLYTKAYDIVIKWEEELSDNKVPSEKLVKETIDSLSDQIVNLEEKYDSLEELIEDVEEQLKKINIVKEWSTPASDDNIPSEKLVKDTVDTINTEIDSINDKIAEIKVNNGILTITRNGDYLGEFSANQEEDTTIDLNTAAFIGEYAILPTEATYGDIAINTVDSLTYIYGSDGWKVIGGETRLDPPCKDGNFVSVDIDGNLLDSGYSFEDTFLPEEAETISVDFATKAEQTASGVNIDNALLGKAPKIHLHVITDITGLQVALNSKATNEELKELQDDLVKKTTTLDVENIIKDKVVGFYNFKGSVETIGDLPLMEARSIVNTLEPYDEVVFKVCPLYANNKVIGWEVYIDLENVTFREYNLWAGLRDAAATYDVYTWKVNDLDLTPEDLTLSFDTETIEETQKITITLHTPVEVGSKMTLVHASWKNGDAIGYHLDLNDVIYTLAPYNTAGDVYNVIENEINYAWDGNRWDPLGGVATGKIEVYNGGIKGLDIPLNGSGTYPIYIPLPKDPIDPTTMIKDTEVGTNTTWSSALIEGYLYNYILRAELLKSQQDEFETVLNQILGENDELADQILNGD